MNLFVYLLTAASCAAATKIYPEKSSQPKSTHSSPNILLIITDQFRFDAWSEETTPNLSRLSKQAGATTFTSAYSSTPTCTPSRAGLLTGRSPWNHGMLGYDKDVDCANYPTTLPRVLNENGYTTFVSGKDHFGTNSDGTFISQGYENLQLYDGLTEENDHYDQWFHSIMGDDVDPLATGNLTWNAWQSSPYVFEEYLHPTAWTSSRAVSYLDTFDFTGSSKMFLKASFHRPHSPYDPPKRLYDKYTSMDPSLPIFQRNINPGTYDDAYLNTTTMGSEAWNGDPGPSASFLSRAAYLASVEFVDEGIGDILSKVEETDEEFMIIWVADHGDMNGDHNLWRKGYPFEESSHVPMIMKHPTSTSPPKSSSAIVEIRDVAVTIWDVIGKLEEVKENDELINGLSLLPILEGEKEKVRDYVDLEHNQVYSDNVHWNAIRGEGGIKYIFNSFDGREQLFNVTSDRYEKRDLALESEYQEELGVWRQRMVEQFEEEGRGEEWVKDGELVMRKDNSLTHSPNFPCL
ncbi:hypothetical protein TrST_g4822 [Triparma strigata]|uniref:Sulfatase N-terminal domain-containing protein n=1 Tax=Triparma strigata TaxID=1606541 RepID=A0A9W7B7I0_9STRA|nr:hypothetical protein TrST_g4822 [Triparma strigata]